MISSANTLLWTLGEGSCIHRKARHLYEWRGGYSKQSKAVKCGRERKDNDGVGVVQVSKAS